MLGAVVPTPVSQAFSDTALVSLYVADPFVTASPHTLRSAEQSFELVHVALQHTSKIHAVESVQAHKDAATRCKAGQNRTGLVHRGHDSSRSG